MAGRSNPDKPPIEERRAQRRAAEAEAQRHQTSRTIPDDWRDRNRRTWTDEAKAEIIEETLERMIYGQSIAEMCRLAHFPAASKLLEWLMATHATRSSYVRAREICAELFANEIVAISDNIEEDPNSRRVRIESRKWVATRILPKTYGDKIEVIETGKTIPSGHLMDLVQVSDTGADAMLLLEHAIDDVSTQVIDQEPVLSDAADVTEPSAEQKKSPGSQGTRG